MNIRKLIFGVSAVALTTWSGSFHARADLEVSGSISIHATADFHTPLATHGTWIEVGSHGRCWRPSVVAVEWRPYCDGHWVWTDCGWYWASDEPWAWACYHYGRWTFETGHGWIWVPGIEWAPAWVSWRMGGGYCGWAPLAPHGVIVAPAQFVFVETHRFAEPVRPRTVIVNNTTILNKTTVINNNVKAETRTVAGAGPRKVMVNEGPGVAPIEQASKKKVSRVAINEAARQAPLPAAVGRKSAEPAPKEGGVTKGKESSPGVDASKPAPGRREGSVQPEKPDRPDRPDKPDKPGKPERSDEPKSVPTPPAQPERPSTPPPDKVQPGKVPPGKSTPKRPERPPRGKERKQPDLRAEIR